MRAKIHSVAEFELEIQRLLEEVREESRADAVTFHYYDEGNDRLILPVAVGLLQETRFKSWLPSMSRVAGKVIRSGTLVIAEDAEHHSYMRGPFTYAEKIKSAAGLPLTATSGGKIGVLFVSYRTRHPFSRDEQAALADLAVQTADTIQSWLTKRLKADLSAHPGLPRLEIALQEIADGITKALGDVAAAIWMPERDRQTLVIKAHSGPTGKFVRGTSLNLTQSSVVTDAFKTGGPANASIDNEPVFKDEARLTRWQEVWAFPVSSGSRVLGVLCIWTVGYYGLTEQEKARIGAFVELTARTIENEQRILTLNTLQSVGARLTFMLADPRLMSEIVKSAAQVMGADNITLHQYDPERRQFCDVDKSVTYRAPQPLQRPRKEGGASAYVRDYGYVIIEDMDKLDEATRKMAWTKHVLEVGVKAYLGIRLRANEDTLGVLFFNYLRPRRFSPDEIAIAEIFADYAATAIHNARLFERAKKRTQELAALNEVGQALTSGIRLQQDEILELIHDQASKLMDTNNMYIALYDEPTDTVRFGLAMLNGKRVDVEKEEAWQPRKAGKGKTEEIIRTKQPIFHATKAKAEAWYALPEHEEYVGAVSPSWIGVPMMVGDKVLGVIATYHPTRDHVYNEDDLQILSAMASQAAIALSNAMLYSEVDQALGRSDRALGRRIKDLQVLNEVGQTLTSGIRLQQNEVLELICRQTTMLMDTRNMYIALYDQATDTVSFGLAFEDSERVQVGEGAWAPRVAGEGATEAIIRTRKPLLFRTAKEAKEWYARPESKEYTGIITERYGYLGVPMMIGEKVLGVIALRNHEEDNVYDEGDLTVLSTIASQAAIALENARLFEAEQKWTERLQALHEVNRELTASMDPERVWGLILARSAQLTGAHYSTIQTVDEKTSELALRLTYPEDRTPPFGKFKRIPIGKGITGWVAQHRKSLLVKDVAQDDRYVQYLKDTRSELAVPLIIDEILVGVLNVEHTGIGGLDERDQELLVSFASQAAVAIQNAQRYEDRQRALVALREEQTRRLAAERWRTLGQATTNLAHRMNNLAGIIPVCVQRVRERVEHEPTVAKNLDMIEQQTKFLLSLSAGLLRPFTPSALRKFDVNVLMREALATTRSTLEEQGIQVALHWGENIPKVRIRKLLSEAFVEMITNAAKAMPEGGKLTIETRLSDDNRVEIVFIDTGRGIPVERQSQVFELFGKGKGPPEEVEYPSRGIGFGLWWVKTFLQQWDGDVILLRSEAGKGSTFVIKLSMEG